MAVRRVKDGGSESSGDERRQRCMGTRRRESHFCSCAIARGGASNKVEPLDPLEQQVSAPCALYFFWVAPLAPYDWKI